MRITEEFGFFWKELTGWQKAIVIGLVMIIGALTISGWIDSFQSWRQIHAYERQAVEAERAKQDALAKAAKLAADIKVREDALKKVEDKADAKRNEVDEAGKAVTNARADYDRAVREQRVDTPSSDELCAELDALGYPCRQ